MAISGSATACLRSLLTLLPDRSQIDHETIFYIALDHPFVSFVDLLNVDHFNVGDNIMLAAEIQHFLCFGNAADHGTCKAFSAHYQTESCNRQWVFRRTDERHRTVHTKQTQVCIDIVLGRNGVKNEVELAPVSSHLLAVF